MQESQELEARHKSQHVSVWNPKMRGESSGSTLLEDIPELKLLHVQLYAVIFPHTVSMGDSFDTSDEEIEWDEMMEKLCKVRERETPPQAQ